MVDGPELGFIVELYDCGGYAKSRDWEIWSFDDEQFIKLAQLRVYYENEYNIVTVDNHVYFRNLDETH